MNLQLGRSAQGESGSDFLASFVDSDIVGAALASNGFTAVEMVGHLVALARDPDPGTQLKAIKQLSQTIQTALTLSGQTTTETIKQEISNAGEQSSLEATRVLTKLRARRIATDALPSAIARNIEPVAAPDTLSAADFDVLGARDDPFDGADASADADDGGGRENADD